MDIEVSYEEVIREVKDASRSDAQETIEEMKALVGRLYNLGVVSSEESHKLVRLFDKLNADYEGSFWGKS